MKLLFQGRFYVYLISLYVAWLPWLRLLEECVRLLKSEERPDIRLSKTLLVFQALKDDHLQLHFLAKELQRQMLEKLTNKKA